MRLRKDNPYSTKKIVSESAPYSLILIGMPAFDSINRLTLLLYSGAVSLAVFDVSYRVFKAGNSVTRSIRRAMLPSCHSILEMKEVSNHHSFSPIE